MLIGIPKEILSEEKRVAATPEMVQKYIKMGFDVTVESSAGEGIWRSNEEYENSSASIISDTEKLFTQSDVILKVKQPVFNETIEKYEVEMMRNDNTIVQRFIDTITY